MADDGAAVAAGRLLVGQEPAAERRLHAERREEIRGHAEALHPFRLVAANQVDVPPGECRQALNPVALALPIEEIRRGHLLAAVLGIAGAVGQQKDAVHIGERERPDDQRVDHRQDGGVRAEPERERQHDEARRATDAAGWIAAHISRRGRGCASGSLLAAPKPRVGVRSACGATVRAGRSATRGEAPVCCTRRRRRTGWWRRAVRAPRGDRRGWSRPSPPREWPRAGARPLSAGRDSVRLMTRAALPVRPTAAATRGAPPAARRAPSP